MAGIITDFLGGMGAVIKAPFAGNPFTALRRRPGEQKMADLLLAGGSLGFPGAWTADRIEQIRHYKGWVYIAIRAIANEVACSPPRVAAIRSKNEVKQKGLYVLPDFHRKKALTSVQQHEDLQPMDSDYPLCELLANPNEPDVSFDFWYETIMFLELTGNCYWWVINNDFGLPAALWVLPSHWVWPISGNGRLIDHYQIRPYGTPGSARAMSIPADEIIHFKNKNPLSKIDGMAGLQAGAPWVDSAESIDAARWHSFKNSNNIGMLLSLPEGMEDPPAGYISALYARLDARSRGEGNYNRPLILPSGVVATPNDRSPREMDFYESGNQMRDWIMAMFGVSKTIAGITEDVNYASMIAARANFIISTVRPRLSYIGQVATEKLAKRFNSKLVVYWPDLTPEDPAQKTIDMEADYRMRAITPNQVCRERGREPFEGGDVHPEEAAEKRQEEQAKQQAMMFQQNPMFGQQQAPSQGQQGQEEEGKNGPPQQFGPGFPKKEFSKPTFGKPSAPKGAGK